MPDRPTTEALIAAAQARLTPETWAYLVGGAETETGLRRNRTALDALALRPRVAVDVTEISAVAPILGRDARLPVVLAGIGSLPRLHPEGREAVARAAARFGVPMLVSSVGSPDLSALAKAAPGVRLWSQLYLDGDDAWFAAQLTAARRAGCEALVVTLDTPVLGRRDRQGAVSAWGREEAPLNPHRAGLTWDRLHRLRDGLDLPLILKGIVTAEDAALAADLDVAAIYVSNHGGRQLDPVQATLSVLPEVSAAVAGACPVFIDSGFRRGTDILKALALGAHVVGLGRLYAYGLAGDGEEGVVAVLETLEAEIRTALALLGCPRIADLTSRHVAQAAPLPPLPSLDPAFPVWSPSAERLVP